MNSPFLAVYFHVAISNTPWFG